jgi:hypothetical protein
MNLVWSDLDTQAVHFHRTTCLQIKERGLMYSPGCSLTRALPLVFCRIMLELPRKNNTKMRYSTLKETHSCETGIWTLFPDFHYLIDEAGGLLK